MYQHTIKQEKVLRGIGLHTGKESRLTLKPAKEDTGILFILQDKEGFFSIPALIDYVEEDTTRSTNLHKNGITIRTVEHLLSALYVSVIDNLIIEIEGKEVPIMDGSSLPFWEAIKEAGVVKQSKERSEATLVRPVWLMEESNIFIAIPDNKLTLGCLIDYNHPVIGTQWEQMVITEESYLKEIAMARTFGFREELEELWQKGLAYGGSLDNAILVEPYGYSTALRVEKELLKHKILDLLGDLYLLGYRLRAFLFAIKPSHKSNIKFVKKLRENVKIEKRGF